MTAGEVLRRHLKRHHHPELPMEECGQCLRLVRICRKKIRFGSRELAGIAVVNINVDDGWKVPTVWYRCKICDQYHMTSKLSVGQKILWGKLRRKWLHETEIARRKEAP